MGKHNLDSLSPGRFSELIPNRERKIAESCDILDINERPANRLARSLHPKEQQLIVSEVINHTENTKSYWLMHNPEYGDASVAYFSAGQYISLSVNIDGKQYSRPYSISSSPKEALNGRYRITVRAVPGGIVSNYIINNFKVGTAVLTSAPEGFFTYEPLRDASHILAIAGGSGIPPFVSLAGAVAASDEDCALTILYGSKTRSDVLFYEELNNLALISDKIKVVYILSDERVEGYSFGLIDKSLISRYLTEDTSVFVCGPVGMMDFVKEELAEFNLRKKYVRYELRGESFLKNGCPKKCAVTVHASGKSRVIWGTGEESILRILENAGIAPPNRCRSGECGFCRSRLIHGDVYIPADRDSRRLADLKFGYIHPCSTYPKGDIEIEIASKFD